MDTKVLYRYKYIHIYQHLAAFYAKTTNCWQQAMLLDPFIMKIRLKTVEAWRFGRILCKIQQYNPNEVDRYSSWMKKMACHLLANRFGMSFINRYISQSVFKQRAANKESHLVQMQRQHGTSTERMFETAWIHTFALVFGWSSTLKLQLNWWLARMRRRR